MKKYLIILLIGAGVFCGFTTVDSNRYFEIAKNLEIFTNIYKELNASFVDDVDPGKLMRIGIDAMMKSCDPYTVYWSESEMEGYRFLSEGKYSGIGASYAKKDSFVVFTDIYENSPAEKAGIHVGDRVLKVNGYDAKGRNGDELSALLMGVPGTKIQMQVQRLGVDAPMDFQIVRDEVDIPNVPYHTILPNHIGYIALTTFTNNASTNVTNALRDLKVKDSMMKGVILDLRGNGGGLLNEAISICNIFLPRNVNIVSTRGKVEELNRTFKTTNASVDESIPLVILIDKMSASASEIVSGTMQDYDRAVLIGQRSYGKGLVQNTKDIGYNSRIKLTTSKYYINSGRCIQAVEYKHGEPVELPEDKRTKFKTKNGRVVTDGGGIRPDILMDAFKSNSVLKALDEKLAIVDYVTGWCQSHPSLSDPDQFHFTDWEDFMKYIRTNSFSFQTESELALKSLQEKAKQENYVSAEPLIASLAQQFQLEKNKELEANKTAIINQIEKEIVGRYIKRNGKIRIGLRNDPEVRKATEILNAPSEYQKILKGK